MAADEDRTRGEFREALDTTATELERWPATDESTSGRRIVELLRTKQADLTADDHARMRTVHGHAQRHLPRNRGRRTSLPPACGVR